MSTLSVNTSELQNVAQRLLTEKEEVNNIYNNKVKAIIEASKEAIIASKLDFEDISKQFEIAFTNLETNLLNLSNALSNKIIPQYENLDNSIATSFNSDFANKMREIFK